MGRPRGRPRKHDRFVAPEKGEKPETTNESGDRPSENPGESVAQSQKIQFAAVRLDFEPERLGDTKGLASSTTAYYTVRAGNTITLDTATGLVTISHSRDFACIVVPRERVRFFVPLAEDKPTAA